MVVFYDVHDKDVPVAIFRKWSDAQHFENENQHHPLHRVDLPDLDQQVKALIGQPVTDDPPRN